MKRIKHLIFTILIIINFSLYSQEKEIIGLVKKEQINQKNILVFIIENKERYEVTGKLASFIESFYNNQKIKVLGKITPYSDEEKKEKKLDGQIEIKEIIVTIQ
ncbi:MAG: hypothetical protein KatS3mg129_1175 [Leptospiraceae bacterium]|nr:MAG: hypothetical protein KatS3mg129_1175 [Leptospiraceae bacterium]